MKKIKLSATEIELEIKEKLEAYEKAFQDKHTAKIEVLNNQTYITFDVRDWITEKYMNKILSLVRLMNVELAHYYNRHGEEIEYGLCINDNNIKLVEFIQKFIDNGYKIVVN